MSEISIPPKPERPGPHECCGGGCVPCIYDYYYEELEKWHKKYGDLSAGGKSSTQSSPEADV